MITVWVLGDQLLDPHPVIEKAIQEVGVSNVTVLLIESTERTLRLPYHRNKLILLFSAMRHYAVRLQHVAIAVDYRQADDFKSAIDAHLQHGKPGALWMMAASEFPTRQFQESLVHASGIPAVVHPNTQFLIESHNPLGDVPAGRRVVMETFYRAMRRHHQILLDGSGNPSGGRWNYDAENRKPLPRSAEIALPPSFAPNEITRSVMDMVKGLPQATGSGDGFSLAVTHEQAELALADFIARRLPSFGAYEDAMTVRSATVFHSVLSPYVNIGLLRPMQMIEAAVTAYRYGLAPINSVEAFVRQILGWREYMYWQYWRLMPDLAQLNHWNATRAMPAFFWDGITDMNCLRHVIDRLLTDGYSHHIERLMLVCNFCLLAGVSPSDVCEWFLCLYADAYEWVVLPNVIGMGLHADGGQIGTKPYIASANYINRMSDYCADCRYSPKARTGDDACPFNFLYWNFLIAHETALRSNARLGQNVLGLRHLDAKEREAVQRQAAAFLESLTPYASPGVG